MNTLRLGAAGACLLLAACLSPREDPTRWFVLAPAADAAAATDAATGAAQLVVVGPLHLPGYLQRAEIVRRVGPNQLEPSRIDRWAEPIDRAVLAVLCQDLAARKPGARCVPFPAEPGLTPDHSVEVEITAFELDASGAVRLEGRWHMRGKPSASGAPEKSSNFQLTRPVEGSETQAVVAAMSLLLGDLADAIVAGG